MKKILIINLFIILSFNVSSQNTKLLDLIITSKGDSVACKIDSISKNTNTLGFTMNISF